MKKILQWLRAEWRRAADHKALMAMSAHELSDLGIGRAESGYLVSMSPDVPREAGRPDFNAVPGTSAGKYDAPAGRCNAARHGVFP